MIKQSGSDYIYFTFLSMLYTTILLIAVLMDYKFISIGPVLASSATFIISMTFFLGDVITEVYGYQKGRQVILGGVICLVLFGVVSLVLRNLPTPTAYASYGQAYDVLLGLLFRACISNAIAIALGAYFNVYFISKWKVLVKGKYFWLRSLGSSAVGESLYTLFVVSMLNLGLVSTSHFFDILLVSYSFKLVFNAVAVIPASILVNFLKRTEGVDVYDFPVELTPFKYLKLKRAI